MSYTNKKVAWESCATQPVVNKFGDIIRLEPVEILARKQPKREVFKASDGRELLSKSYFYVDPTIEPNALSIKEMDKLDGELIEHVYVMCDLANRPRMIRFITI